MAMKPDTENKKTAETQCFQRLSGVELLGFEPRTLCLQSQGTLFTLP